MGCGCFGHFEVQMLDKKLEGRTMQPEEYMLFFSACVIEGMSHFLV